MNPFVIGSAISGGASILGTGLNAVFQNNTNSIAQKQFRESMALQKYQYEDMKRYNSPENQVSMMRRAGINPALAYYGGSSPSTVSATGAPSPNAEVQPINFNGLQTAFQGLQGDLNNTSALESQIQANQAAAAKANAEAFGQKIRNTWLDEDMRSIIYNRDMESWFKENSLDLLKANTKLAQTEVQYQQQSLGDRLFEQKWRSENMRAQTEATLLSNAFIPERCREEINTLIQQQKLMVQQGLASVQQAAAAVMSATSQKHAFEAQYGGNPNERSRFFNALLKSYQEDWRVKVSQQYNNYWGKSPLFGTGYWADSKGDVHRTGSYENHPLRNK